MSILKIDSNFHNLLNGISTVNFNIDESQNLSSNNISIISFLNGKGQVLSNCLYGGRTELSHLLKKDLITDNEQYLLPLGKDGDRLFNYIKRSSILDINRDKIQFKVIDCNNKELIESTKKVLLYSIIQNRIPNISINDTLHLSNILSETSVPMSPINNGVDKKKVSPTEVVPDRPTIEVFYLDKLGINEKKSCYIGQEYVTRYLTKLKRGGGDHNNMNIRRGIVMTESMLLEDQWHQITAVNSTNIENNNNINWKPPKYTTDYNKIRGCRSTSVNNGLFLSVMSSQVFLKKYIPLLK